MAKTLKRITPEDVPETEYSFQPPPHTSDAEIDEALMASPAVASLNLKLPEEPEEPFPVLFEVPIEPVNDGILVWDLPAVTKIGTLYIPKQAQDRRGKQLPRQGLVVAVGPGKLSPDGHRLPMSVSKGDWVYYGSTGGYDVEVPGPAGKPINMRMIQEGHLQSRIRPEAAPQPPGAGPEASTAGA